MTNFYMPDAVGRVLRTLVQLIAAGGLTALFDQLVQDAPDSWRPYFIIVFMLIVTVCQNALEQGGVIPALLKPSMARHEEVHV